MFGKSDSVDVLLSPNDFQDPSTWPSNFGSVVGRFANRIAQGKVKIGNQEIQLETNNGPNHLHGGTRGFWDKEFEILSVEQIGEEASVTMRYVSPDGENGYPGELDVRVVYSLNVRNDLTIKFTATTSKATIVNLCNHAYWNLAGHDSGSVLGHTLHLPNSTFYTPLNSLMIPTGEIFSVKGTAFDFLEPHTLGERIDFFKNDDKSGCGYDLNFVINHGQVNKTSLTVAAILKDVKSNRTMTVLTDAPGMQLYTANWLDFSNAKQGAHYKQFHGVCLETQNFPNAPNYSHFPSCLLLPDQMYSHTVQHKFDW